MIVEKTVIRNTDGRIATIRERTLSPAEELAANVYAKVLAFSRHASNANLEEPIFTVYSLPEWAHADALVAAVLELARVDTDLWSRTGWKGLRVRVLALALAPEAAAGRR